MAAWEEYQTQYAQEQAAKSATRDLDAGRFAWLLAFYGLDDVWADVEQWAKANDTTMYAELRAHAASGQYRLERTLTVLTAMNAVIAALHPNTDVSEATIRSMWAAANAVDL